ncbi:MAG: hypothetical protein CL878_07395, partial [Dehalococcoidia bacterium]|nr:hypothetical protein [Dehalococcoidia bacterium]
MVGKAKRAERLVAMLGILLYLAYVAAVGIAWVGVYRGGQAGLHGLESAAVPDGLVIGRLERGGPADSFGLRDGDVILGVEGVRPDSDLELQRAFRARQPGERVTLRIRRAVNGTTGLEQDVVLVLSPALSSRNILIDILASTIVGLLAVVVAGGVALARPGDPTARLLLLTSTAFAMTLALLVWITGGVATYIVGQAFFLAFVFSGAALLHLFLSFPATHPFIGWLLRLGPAPPQRVGAGVWLLYIVPIGAGTALVFWSPGTALWSYYLGTGLMLLAIATLVRSYLRATSPLARAQIQYILLALALGVIALLLGPVTNVATQGEVALLPDALVIGSWSLFPLAIGVAVLRFRLFDITVVLRAVVTYPLLTVVVVAEFFVILFGVSQAAVWMWGPEAAASPIVAAVAAVAVAGLAHPLQVGLQKLLDGMLYQHRVARERFREEANEQLGHAQPPEEVTVFLTDHAVERLDLVGAWLVLPAGMSEGRSADLPGPAPDLLERLQSTSKPVALAAGGELESSPVPVLPAEDPAFVPWYEAGGRVLVPLCTDAPSVQARTSGRGDLSGVWVVGMRRCNDLFDRDDLAMLTRVGQQAAVVVDYARLHRQELQQEIVQHDLARAREIQAELLPTTLGGWPGQLELAARLRPARETSGDFYDVIALGVPSTVNGALDPLQIAVGDVAGKGIGAALVMAEALTTLRACTTLIAREGYAQSEAAIACEGGIWPRKA